MNPEQKFNALRQQLDSLDTTAMQTRIEARLRLAWAQQHSAQSTPMDTTSKSSWRWLSYTLAGTSLAGLAFITTLATQPAVETPTKLSAEQTMDDFIAANKDEKSNSAGLSVQEFDLKTDDYSGTEYTGDDWEHDTQLDGATINPSYTYTANKDEKQLFDESVQLEIDVKGELLDVIHNLRNQVETLNGYLINISYYDTAGTIDIQLPADQLQTFEDQLATVDATHQVEVLSYNVANVSEEVAIIDAEITAKQKEIDQAKTDLTAANLTATERQALQDKISAGESYIQTQQTTKEETIAEYSLVDVRVTIHPYQSWTSGNYYQYDRSTFTGSVQYELGRAMYTLIHGTGKLARFLVWLAVYSVVLIPLFIGLRWFIRKLIRFFKQL